MRAATALLVELRRVGLDVWIDREHPPPSSTKEQEEAGPTPENPLFRHLVSAISKCDAIIYVASPSSFSSEYVRFEFDPRILYQEFQKTHPHKQPKDLPFYVLLVEPLAILPPIWILSIDAMWSGRILNLTGSGSTPLILPTVLTTIIKELAPDHLLPLNPVSEYGARMILEENAKEASGCPQGVSPKTWLRLEGYFGLGPLFPGPLPMIDENHEKDEHHENQLRYGMYRTGDAARIVDSIGKMMMVPKELSILLSLWTANMRLRSNKNRVFDDKDLAIEYNLPSCLKQALALSNKDLAMAIRLQFAFGLLSSPKKVNKSLASIILRQCKEYFENLNSKYFIALLDILENRSTNKQLSQNSLDTVASINMDPYDDNLLLLYHKLLDAAFSGPRLEKTESYHSTLLSLTENYLKASSELKSGFAKPGNEKFNPEFWIKIEPPNEWYKKGYSFASEGNYVKAIEFFDKALEVDPINVQALNNKGLALEALGRNDEAIQCFDTSISINPNYYFAYRNKGIVLYNLTKYAESIESFDKALEINPKDPILWYNKGRSLFSILKYDEAIESFDKALKIDPSDSNSLRFKGGILNVLGKYKDALEYFDKALEIDPYNSTIWYSRGLSFHSIEDYKKAIESFDKALEIDPNNKEANEFRNIALKYMKQ